MKLEIIKEIDIKEKRWCDFAALVYVKGGNSRLTTDTSKELWDNDDNYSLSHVMLNGKPIVQSNIPFCPTCSGMLARGYGIENIDTPELNEIRNKINAPFVDLQKSIEDIKPILGLLEDGYYIIADAMLYPTDGEDRFFMNVPDKLTYNEAVTQDYYNHDYITVSECFPAYLYPTQSNKYLNITRSREYCDIIDKDNAPRAIAYYHYGFICALLDGHHKAYAAAMKGVRLHSLIIIPCQYVLTKIYKNTERYGVFADINISMTELPDYKAKKHKSDESEQIVIDYIIDHEPGDSVYKIADGYWC